MIPKANFGFPDIALNALIRRIPRIAVQLINQAVCLKDYHGSTILLSARLKTDIYSANIHKVLDPQKRRNQRPSRRDLHNQLD